MHHQMGLTMAQEELKNGKDSEMKKMAQKIIDKQQQGVKQLDACMAKHKAAPSSAIRKSQCALKSFYISTHREWPSISFRGPLID